MKTPLRFLMMICFGIGLVSLARAGDITGVWQSEFDSQIGTQKYVFTFKVDGEKLTGTAAGDRSGDKSSVAIEQGRVNKDGVYFVERLNYQGQDLVIEYTGKVTGDNEIKFTRKVGDFATEEIVAKRVQGK